MQTKMNTQHLCHKKTAYIQTIKKLFLVDIFIVLITVLVLKCLVSNNDYLISWLYSFTLEIIKSWHVLFGRKYILCNNVAKTNDTVIKRKRCSSIVYVQIWCVRCCYFRLLISFMCFICFRLSLQGSKLKSVRHSLWEKRYYYAIHSSGN